MTANHFRKLALALPEAVAAEHLTHPDFRVHKKIFATLGPDEDWGMAKPPTEEQARLVQLEPDVFSPANGAWGRSDYTIIQLVGADKLTVKEALLAAWRKAAPKECR